MDPGSLDCPGLFLWRSRQSKCGSAILRASVSDQSHVYADRLRCNFSSDIVGNHAALQ
jgi:hypothetical protein